MSEQSVYDPSRLIDPITERAIQPTSKGREEQPVVGKATISPLKPHNQVNHPRHYTSHPSGVECITITEHMSFNLGNAVKYIWRADEKGAPIQDLEKAAWYINREIERRRRTSR